MNDGATRHVMAHRSLIIWSGSRLPPSCARSSARICGGKPAMRGSLSAESYRGA
jgi:hypothetical protein